MLNIKIPDQLQNKIINFAILTGQTPEQTVLEIIEERIDHQSAYDETTYLMKSQANRERLDDAIRDIRNGLFEEHELIND